MVDLRSKNYELGNTPEGTGTSSFLTLPSSFLSTGLPLTSAASRPATETQGPTAQLQKLVAGRGINTTEPALQVSISGRARLCRAAVIPSEAKRSRGTPWPVARCPSGSLDWARDDGSTESRPTKQTLGTYPSTISSGSSFDGAAPFGKWRARSLPASSIASARASVKFSF